MDFRRTAAVLLMSSLLSACFEMSGHKTSADFESCLANGGDILESYPRSCVIDGSTFDEVIDQAAQFETRKMEMTVGPKTASCQGAHAIDQQCLIVNGEYFYEAIEGFQHQPGVTATIEVERTQICDPKIVNSCPQDIGIYRYRLLRALTQEGAAPVKIFDNPVVFIGEIVNIKSEKDGFTVSLKSVNSAEMLNAVISPANLGINSQFDFAYIHLGRLLKVTGRPFSLGEQKQMAATSVMSYQNVTVADRKATVQERNACIAIGGEIHKVGKLQADRCVQRYPDSGNHCSDSEACFGQCLVSGVDANSLIPGAQVAGACSVSNNSFGCKALVENGRYKGTLCID